ncbi:ribosome maturation factor RimM [Gleimia hominis]|uniref:Ribosome maturation factor RimM n=1 Tax=Gleimia hominis TaxID=595468 RepID=A0ABU3IC23_9ACTO|nr:ribosome maturation factor RimM [Gleimia hominis]MDT3767925.1 ribosome maturation factor RimM [Gleimia hominis]
MDVTVGIVGPAHALKGEVLVDTRSDVVEKRIYPGAQLRTEPAAAGPLTVQTVRVHKGRLAVRFEGVSDRNAAESLRGVHLVVDTDEVEPEVNAWYPHELRGLTVCDSQERELGVVKDLQLGAAQDLLVVSTERGDVLVPFVEAIVPVVDVPGGYVRVTPPGGLFDDDFE